MNTTDDLLCQRILTILDKEIPHGTKVRNLATIMDKAVAAFAVSRAAGRKTAASRIYGCQRVTFSRKLKKYEIDARFYDPDVE